MKKQVTKPKPTKSKLPKGVKIKGGALYAAGTERNDVKLNPSVKKDTTLESAQLARLDLRLGKGIGAVRERARLLGRMKI